MDSIRALHYVAGSAMLQCSVTCSNHRITSSRTLRLRHQLQGPPLALHMLLLRVSITIIMCAIIGLFVYGGFVLFTYLCLIYVY